MQLPIDQYDFIKISQELIESEERELISVTKLSNFLLLITDILNCSYGCEVSALCRRLENLEIKGDDTFKLTTSYTQDWSLNKDLSLVEHSSVVKKMLFCDSSMKTSLKLSVKALLECLVVAIESDLQSQNTLQLATTICRFLKACETNHPALVTCCALKEFFNKLFHILSDFDGPGFLLRASSYQFVGKLIGCFKEVRYARQLVLSELSVKLKMLSTLLATQCKSQQVLRMHFYENYLLYLTILKDFLEYNLHESVLNPTATTKAEDTTILQINQSLSNILDKLPFYVQRIIQDCLSLIS